MFSKTRQKIHRYVANYYLERLQKGEHCLDSGQIERDQQKVRDNLRAAGDAVNEALINQAGITANFASASIQLSRWKAVYACPSKQDLESGEHKLREQFKAGGVEPIDGEGTLPLNFELPIRQIFGRIKILPPGSFIPPISG